MANQVVSLFAAIVVSCACVGCSKEQSPSTSNGAPSEAPESSTNTADSENHVMSDRLLVVSKQVDDGQPERVGVLTFNEQNQPSLSTEGKGPIVEQFKRDWAEISSQGELIWKTSEPDTKDGEPIMRVVGEKVRPGDENYIYGVLNTLQRKYGYDVELSE